MKRKIIILLIAASVGVTIYINSVKTLLDPEVRSQLENALLEQPEFPARPVWWEDDSVMAIGVVNKNENHDAEAKKACQIAATFGITDLKVEVYDILKIQQFEEWTLIGQSSCKPKQ